MKNRIPFFKSLFALLLCLFAANHFLYAQAEIQNPNFPFWKIKGNSGTTAPTSLIGTAVNNNFIGNTDATDFALVTNNLERMRISSSGFIGINSIPTLNDLVYINRTSTLGFGANRTGLYVFREGNSGAQNGGNDRKFIGSYGTN